MMTGRFSAMGREMGVKSDFAGADPWTLDIQGMGRRHNLGAEVDDVYGGSGGVLPIFLLLHFLQRIILAPVQCRA